MQCSLHVKALASYFSLLQNEIHHPKAVEMTIRVSYNDKDWIYN